jgi:hypothetical protein
MLGVELEKAGPEGIPGRAFAAPNTGGGRSTAEEEVEEEGEGLGG